MTGNRVRGAARRAATAAAHPIALVTLAGAIVRLATMVRQPIGYDEDFTAVTVHQTPERMMDIVRQDITPPLFYALERIVVAIFDALGLHDLGGPGGPIVIRLVPALAGVALIPLMAALATRMAGGRANTDFARQAGIWTAIVVAFGPLTVWLSGFARVYALAATLLVASALLLWQAVEPAEGPPTDRRPRPRAVPWTWLAYFVTAAAAIWCTYFSVFAIGGMALAALWLRPRLEPALKTIAVTGAACLSILPWLVVASAQLAHRNEPYWISPLNWREILGTIGQLLAGPGPHDTVVGRDLIVAVEGVAIVAWVVVLGALIARWRALGPSARRGLLFGLVASSGVLLLVLASVVKPLLDFRYATLSWMPMLAVGGLALAAIRRWVAAVATAALVAATLVSSVPITHNEVRELIPELNDMVGPHDLVAATFDEYLIVLDESNATVREKLHLLRPDEPRWYLGVAAYPPDAVIHAVPQETIDNLGRIYWVATPGATSKLIPPNYHAIESRCVLMACLTVYEP